VAHLLLLNGPNLNLLGVREPGVYGHVTLEQIHERMTQLAAEDGHRLSAFQSNSEAELIERIHQAPAGHVAFIIFNPAGLTHTSIALRDALLAVKIPFIECIVQRACARVRHLLFLRHRGRSITGPGHRHELAPAPPTN
jgi:3-dehydroquinate dehydratase-2